MIFWNLSIHEGGGYVNTNIVFKDFFIEKAICVVYACVVMSEMQEEKYIMKFGNKEDVFKLMDSNGRRKDIVNALNGYLGILDEMAKEGNFLWKPIKSKEENSLTQYRFYEKALEISKDVFKKHSKYDYVISQLETHGKLKEAIEKNDLEWLREHISEYPEILKQIDIGMEARARFYTDTLVNLGFANKERMITPAGRALLGQVQIEKDKLESLFPLSNINIIYLRQLLKLRIFSDDEQRYYSPFCLAIYALLRRERIDSSDFFEMIQGINPNMEVGDGGTYIDHYYEGKYWDDLEIEIPAELNVSDKLQEDVFKSFFTSGKTQESVNIYWEFYELLYEFNANRSQSNLKNLLLICENESKKDIIKKAFGYGRSMFGHKKGQNPTVEEFLEKDATAFFCDNLNGMLYHRFVLSKKTDEFREKADTTKRIFTATGLIKFDNGYVELAYREICKYVFQQEKLKRKFIGKLPEDMNTNYSRYSEYEGNINSFFCGNYSTEKILGYTQEEYREIMNEIVLEFHGSALKEIPEIMKIRRNHEFKAYIETEYPESKVKELLALFSDRSNDREIRKRVNPDATVPTIYEYLVGIAWFYFSNKRIDLLDSYNLNLSANFEPISFAPGGDGDIVIREADKVIMLEVTLMNENAQKRGEWEPVLRHSVNLKVEEEKQKNPRKVTTFFIADSFDNNTINIWKAVSSVPLESSINKNEFTDHVVIMPVNTEELMGWMDKKDEYDSIIEQVRSLFISDSSEFDMEWRSRFMSSIAHK